MFFFRRQAATLSRIEQGVADLLQRQEKLMSEVDDLVTAVGAITTAVTDAVSELKTLAGGISANSADPAAMEDAANKLNALATTLEGAVAAAQPAPATPPATPPSGP